MASSLGTAVAAIVTVSTRGDAYHSKRERSCGIVERERERESETSREFSARKVVPAVVCFRGIQKTVEERQRDAAVFDDTDLLLWSAK